MAEKDPLQIYPEDSATKERRRQTIALARQILRETIAAHPEVMLGDLRTAFIMIEGVLTTTVYDVARAKIHEIPISSCEGSHALRWIDPEVKWLGP